jgi:beta-mannosidase
VPVGAAHEGESASISRAWTRVSVPGHWQLEDAFVAYEGLVLYRCAFEWRPSPREKMTTLRFGGVYYSARVWLNGIYLGGHEGYIASFEFDVTDRLSYGENELLVEVYSPEEREENDRETIGGVWARWDGLAPHFNPGGITREVELVASSGEVRIRSVQATADGEGYGRARVELYARRAAPAKLRGRVRPLGFEAPGARFEREVRLEAGTNRFGVDFRVPQVRTWSTWDRGGGALYELDLRCEAEWETARFGARTVELRNWQTYLNGERVFLRGINYLPTDVYPARASEERLRADASLVREAGMNAVRVHAHVAEKAFYRACDELGLLVFQDFPLQWTHRRSVLGPAVRQSREMAAELAGHPSVGVYLAHDEPFYVVPPEKWTPLKLARTAAEILAPRWALWQRRVLDPAVARSIREEDGTRPVIEAAGHPLTTNHLYFGWYYGRFRNLERAVAILPGLSRLPTEYGAQALPDAASLEEIWPPGEPPDWEGLSVNYRLQWGRMLRYVPWRGELEAFIRESQEYQSEVLKHATELFRRRKYRPTGGAFAFMLNDPAPAISWSVVDWRRRPKAAYGTLQTVMNPVLLCAPYPRESYEGGTELRVPVFVVNDLARALGEVDWSWEALQGGSGSGGGRAEIPADSVVRVGEAAFRLPATGCAVLRLSLYGAGAGSSNEYRFKVRRRS